MNNTYTSSGFMDGRAYIIGRAGHIQIDDSSVSRMHAEIAFIDGRIKLRDLRSTNGTFIDRGGKFVRCYEEYVNPDTCLKIGSCAYSVQSLLESFGIYTVPYDDTDFTITLAKPSKKIRFAPTEPENTYSWQKNSL